MQHLCPLLIMISPSVSSYIQLLSGSINLGYSWSLSKMSFSLSEGGFTFWVLTTVDPYFLDTPSLVHIRSPGLGAAPYLLQINIFPNHRTEHVEN